MNVYMRRSDYRNWTYYKVKYKISRHVVYNADEVVQVHNGEYWTPYGQFIEDEVEQRAEQTGWKIYSWEWEIIEEKRGIPSREEHPHMVMEI